MLETSCNNMICDGNGIIVDTNNIRLPRPYPRREQSGVRQRRIRCMRSTATMSIFVNNTTVQRNNHSPAINEGQIAALYLSNDGNILNNVMWAFTGKQVNGDGNYDYNLYFNGTPVNQGPHDVVANPMFANASCDDFRLLAGLSRHRHRHQQSCAGHRLAQRESSERRCAGYDRGAYEFPSPREEG